MDLDGLLDRPVAQRVARRIEMPLQPRRNAVRRMLPRSHRRGIVAPALLTSKVEDSRMTKLDDHSHHADPDHAETDPRDAAIQEQVRADRDALEETARRVRASVPANVRDTPVRPNEH